MGWCKISGKERIIQHLRVQEPCDGGSHRLHLDLPNEPMPREDLARFTSLRLGKGMVMVWLSRSSHWIHVVRGWCWQSRCTELGGWFDEMCYRKIKETSNTYQLFSHISLQVVSHSALTDVLSKPASKRTKRWVFHHFPRDSCPWPNRSCRQEGFFYIFSLIFPILNFIPLLLVKPTPIVLNNSLPSGIYPLRVFVGYSFVPL